MKIKILSLIILVNVLASLACFAQEKEPLFYFKVYTGDGLFTPGSNGLYPGAVYGVQNGSTGTYSYSKKHLGAGFNDGLGLEKSLGKIFSVGLDLNFLHGKTLSSSYSVYPPASANVNYVTYAGTASYSVTTFIPNISAKVFQSQRYFIYTRLGMILTTKVKYQNEENYLIQGNGTLATTDNIVQTNKYGINTGLNTAVGIRFNIWGPVKGSVEINDNFLSVSPKSASQDGAISEDGQLIFIHDDITYIKSNSGATTSYSAAAANGTGGGSITAVDTERSFSQHINNIVLNVGLALAVK